MAHAKIYMLIRKLKLTTDGQIFAFLTYFEKLSRRSQESVDYPSAIQPPEAQSI